MHFVDVAATREIHAEWWPEGETVSLRPFTWLDEQRISERSTTVDRSDPDNVLVQVDNTAWNEARLDLGVVDWTVSDAQGNTVPCTAANKRRLGRKDALFILGEIQDLNKERTADEQRSF